MMALGGDRPSRVVKQQLASARVLPVLEEMSARAGIETPELCLTRRAGPSICRSGGRCVLKMPRKRALNDRQERLIGTVAHEVSHASLGHLVEASREQTRAMWWHIVGMMVSMVGCVGVAGVFALVRFPELSPFSSSPIQVLLPVILLAAVGVGAVPWLIFLERKSVEIPGWEGTQSRERELAADLFAAQLAGKAPVLAALEAMAGNRFYRWGDGVHARVVGRFHSHPGSSTRIDAVEKFDVRTDARQVAVGYFRKTPVAPLEDAATGGRCR